MIKIRTVESHYAIRESSTPQAVYENRHATASRHASKYKLRWTLTDILLKSPAVEHNDSSDPLRSAVSQYPNHLVPINLQTQILKDTFLEMCQGKIDLDEQPVKLHDINERDTYYEFDLTTFFHYPLGELKRILREHKVIICDFEDGLGGRDINESGTWLQFIMSLRIVPREVICLTSNITEFEYEQLNIKSVTLPIWMIITIGCTGFLTNVYHDNKARQLYLDMLERDKKFALCPNFKPRAPRLAFLGEMHKRNLLDTMDWSLIGYNYREQVDAQALMNPLTDDNSDYWKLGKRKILQDMDKDRVVYLNHNLNDSFNKVSEEYADYYYKTVSEFLPNIDLPKLLPDNDKHPSNIVSISDHLVGKYYWHIVNETMLDHKVALIKYGIVTEKTFKAMIAGAMPLICGPNGTDDYLEGLGFKIHKTDIDEYNNIGKSIRLADCYQDIYNRQQLPDKEDVMYNAEKLLDKKFVCSKIIEPLMENCNGKN